MLFDSVGLTISETGYDTFSVKLAQMPNSYGVIIDIYSQNTNEATVSPVELNFDTGNWDQWKSVTVTGVPDGITDGDKMVYILLTVQTSSDQAFSRTPRTYPVLVRRRHFNANLRCRVLPKWPFLYSMRIARDHE